MTDRKPIAESREEQLVRASKIRALVTSYLAGQTAPITKVKMEMELQEQLKEIGCDTHALAYQLKYMSDSNRIKRIDEAGAKPVYHALDHIPTKPPKLGVTMVAPAQPKVATKAVPQMQHTSQQNMQHHMSIDMVKSTGRVRISTQGMILEIGVVDN